MKSVTAPVPFTFKYSGTKTFSFDPATPELATDIEAKIILERFGSNVTITDMEPDALEVPVVEAVPAPEPEPTPLEVVAPVEESPVVEAVTESPVIAPAPEAE